MTSDSYTAILGDTRTVSTSAFTDEALTSAVTALEAGRAQGYAFRDAHGVERAIVALTSPPTGVYGFYDFLMEA
jgi:hypothetical protein